MIKELVYLPYHDWRKIESEGNRTRDAHFIDSFRKNANIDLLLIINRPITLVELVLKKKKTSFEIKGELVFKHKSGRLYKLDDKTYVLDFISFQDILQLFLKRKWFFKAYGNVKFHNFYVRCLEFLKLDNPKIITANIFTSDFIEKVNTTVLFDAWDNFYLMPGLANLKDNLYKAYSKIAKKSSFWTTNSEENKSFYLEKYKVDNIEIIKNGVSVGLFEKKQILLPDLEAIKNQGNLIAGFGGKITHLFDVEIYNYITFSNPTINFIIIGQILDNKVFSEIVFRENVYYFGDKHYTDYPKYIANIDIGIIPYRIDDGQHGGDSIKAYEYLAAGLQIVGTRGNGLQYLEEYLNIADSKEEFNDLLTNPKEKSSFPIKSYSWEEKSVQMLHLLEGER